MLALKSTVLLDNFLFAVEPKFILSQYHKPSIDQALCICKYKNKVFSFIKVQYRRLAYVLKEKKKLNYNKKINQSGVTVPKIT